MSGSALSRQDRWAVLASGVFAMALFYFGLLRPWDLTHWFMVGAPIGRDFVNFWLGGYLALHDRLDLLVDAQGYNELISRTFAHEAPDHFVFSYPPHIVLVLLPFGAMPFAVAVAIWTALNLVCVFHAANLLRPRPGLAALACLAPAVLVMVAYGHFGGVLALLATFVLVKGKERPVLAGLCLAAMTVKPQIALMFGVFLLLTGFWRVVAISIPATLMFVAVSVVALGVRPWLHFMTWTVPYQTELLSDFVHSQLKSTISLYAGARMLGWPAWAAQAIQWAFSLVSLAGAVTVYIRRGPEPRSVAIALSVVVLALPYANGYDLAIAAPALTLAFFSESLADRRPFLPLIPALLFWIAPVFAFIFGIASWPVVPGLLAVVLLLAIVREMPPTADSFWGLSSRWRKAEL
jgi:hypothetical protein